MPNLQIRTESAIIQTVSVAFQSKLDKLFSTDFTKRQIVLLNGFRDTSQPLACYKHDLDYNKFALTLASFWAANSFYSKTRR